MSISLDPLANCVWDNRYRLRGAEGIESSIEVSWRRAARALAAAERSGCAGWERRFYAALEDFRFLPGGRIQAGAGSTHHVTLFNCFVMGAIEDSLDGIFEALKEGAVTMQQGGGVGYDFSTLRPAGEPAQQSGNIASGPVSFMHIWDAMCRTILSTGTRRGAMMATLRCDHPDIEAFADAKRERDALRNFNLSVLVSDDFMHAVEAGEDWPLRFPGRDQAQSRIVRQVPARALWERIVRASYDCAEPGVIFIDTVNRTNNLWYCERICATNPCGEIPLPPYGACDLGSLNLTRFVQAPFSAGAKLDFDAMAATAGIAVRMLDNVYDIAHFPLARQRETALASRRIGLGMTGLADALVMLGLRYGSAASLDLAGQAMQTICHAAYRSSVTLAREKGRFPLLDVERYLQGPFVAALPSDIVAEIRRHGIRNSHLTAIAPTGSVSLLAGNVSSGLEPVYACDSKRRVRLASGVTRAFTATDYACRLYRDFKPDAQHPPPGFVAADQVEPAGHLAMQAALQPYVDNAISKTINTPADVSYEQWRSIYANAYRLGLKGITAFRPNRVRNQVLSRGRIPSGADTINDEVGAVSPCDCF